MRDFDKFHDAVLRFPTARTKREAFDTVNDMHEAQTGEKRYVNYDSYMVQVSRKFRRNDREH